MSGSTNEFTTLRVSRIARDGVSGLRERFMSRGLSDLPQDVADVLRGSSGDAAFTHDQIVRAALMLANLSIDQLDAPPAPSTKPARK